MPREAAVDASSAPVSWWLAACYDQLVLVLLSCCEVLLHCARNQ